MSLPLIAFILLAGPANGSAGNHINRHVNRRTDIPTTRTTVTSTGAHNKSISAAHNQAPARPKPRPTAVPHKTGGQLVATKSLPATTSTTARHAAQPQPTPTQPARAPWATSS